MRIRQAFRLITLAMVATTIGFASYLLMEDSKAYTSARRSDAILQAIRTTLIAAEKVSAERGPSNAALGAGQPVPRDLITAMSQARDRSDASLRSAIAALEDASCQACGPAKATVELARTDLLRARADIDQLTARPLAERRDVQKAVAAMFAIIDEILPAADGLMAALERTAPAAAQHAVAARIAAELREYAGRAGSEFTGALVDNRPLRGNERERLEGDLGRVHGLGDQIRQRVSQHLLANATVQEAEAALRNDYFGNGIAYLRQVEALGPGEARPSTAELAHAYVPRMAPIVAMRDAELDLAQATVLADTTRALQMLGALTAVLTLSTAFVAIALWLFGRRVLQPLTQATAATVELANGHYDLPLPIEPKQDEIGAIFVALEQLRANLMQKVALESERMELIERLQAAAEHNRARVRELAQARDAAEASARAKSSFLAMMSHEVRTPLHGILGLMELLEDSPLSAEQQRQLRLARESGQALGQVLDDVLDYAKIEAGRLHLVPAPLDLRRLFDDVLSLLAPRAQAKALVIRQWVQPAIPAQLLADSVRLRQILVNLLGNAVKFTERGSVEMRASVEAVDTGVPILSLTVEDSGIGIAKDDIPRLFTPFVQSEGGATRRFGGTGLGLAISRQLAQLTGGELTLESELHVGTRATLRLPLLPANAGTASRPESTSMLPL